MLITHSQPVAVVNWSVSSESWLWCALLTKPLCKSAKNVKYVFVTLWVSIWKIKEYLAKPVCQVDVNTDDWKKQHLPKQSGPNTDSPNSMVTLLSNLTKEEDAALHDCETDIHRSRTHGNSLIWFTWSLGTWNLLRMWTYSTEHEKRFGDAMRLCGV